MREISENPVATPLQYTIDSLDELRAAAYHCGLQAIDKAHAGSLTPIYFSSSPGSSSFDVQGNKTTVTANQNYYTIKNSFAKI